MASSDDTDIRSLVLSDHGRVRAQFANAFESEIDGVVSELNKAFQQLRLFEAAAPATQRSLRVLEFLWVALNALVSASNLLLSGLSVPAGHMMRQFGEAAAMALLCSLPEAKILEELDAKRTAFPVQKRWRKVRQKNYADALDVNHAAWEMFVKLTESYHHLSHATVIAVAYTYSHEHQRLVLGAHFDEPRRTLYANELARIASAGAVLAGVITRMAEKLRGQDER